MSKSFLFFEKKFQRFLEKKIEKKIFSPFFLRSDYGKKIIEKKVNKIFFSDFFPDIFFEK